MCELTYVLFGECCEELALRLEKSITESGRLGDFSAFDVAAITHGRLRLWKQLGYFEHARGGVVTQHGASVLLVIQKQRGSKYTVTAKALNGRIFYSKAESALLSEVSVIASEEGLTLVRRRFLSPTRWLRAR